MKSFVSIWYILFSSFLIPSMLGAELKMPLIFDDHMVLQREKPISIWGQAIKNTNVEIQLGTEIYHTSSNISGKWKIQLPSMNAGGPFKLIITNGVNKVVFNDVLIGEVWICSGQSNMQFELKQSAGADKETPTVVNPNIRMFRMNGRHNLGPVPFLTSEMEWLENGDFMNIKSWEYAGPKSAPGFSAVAYHFGKMLYDSLNVPIGLIQNAIGGSTIEAWIDTNAINSSQDLGHLTKNNWYDHPTLHPWVSDRVKKNLEPWIDSGNLNKSFMHPFAPGYLYNCGIRPLIPFSICGVIWYQGESNATSPESYKRLFTLMVESWRTALDQSDLPFLFVQLPRIGNRSRWPEFREAQQKCLIIPNTAMVVTIDEGHPSDVHPREKKIIGERLANLALSKSYNKNIHAESPMLASYGWTPKDNTVCILFRNTYNGLNTKNGAIPKGFFLKGYIEHGTSETILLPKLVSIEGDKITITYPPKFLPVEIKYAWAPAPENNIINSANLPMAPFKIDLKGNN